jgi:hypothetical protein
MGSPCGAGVYRTRMKTKAAPHRGSRVMAAVRSKNKNGGPKPAVSMDRMS